MCGCGVRSAATRPLAQKFGVVDDAYKSHVAAKSPDVALVLVLDGKRLVHPVPNETALQLVVLVNQVPVVLEVTYTVTHGMGIFAKNEGTRHLLISGILLQIGRGRVHRAVDVRIPLQQCAFILDGTTVERLQGVVGNVENSNPFPASLPSDQMMTDGWFLSRSYIFMVRSRWAFMKSGLFPSVPPTRKS